ncbi:replication factor C subunit 1 [Thrips palmi]|uniref:Replication factor C subunit 1 n=1 Tax=Thrips palmi TaxID=161013 RepID=A0A6P8Z418_THRPL|nr:replication factor C subunit 1 [Thrips palmi]
MSKDIRSFFSVQSSKKGSSTSEVKKKDAQSSSSKKKRNVIESDSDEEVFEVKKKTKKSPSPDKKKPKIEPKLVSAADIFGSSTVKRTARENSKKSSEFHNDPDFDKALQDLDESNWMDIDSNNAVKETSQLKAGKEASSSKAVKEASSSHGKADSSPKGPSKSPSKSPYFSKEKVVSKSSEERNLNAFLGKPSTVTEDDNKSNVKKIKLEKDADYVSKASQKISDSSPIKIKKEKEDKEIALVVKKEIQEAGPSKVKIEKKSPETSKNQPKKVEIEIPEKDTKPRLEPSPPSYMWVDKYKPSSIKNIIGQQGDNSNVKKLIRWLSSWHSNHGPGVNKKHNRPAPWAKDDSGAFFKAALLSGPPGVGKTTTAHLVCKEVGMDVVEFNASDTRSQKLMSKEVSELLSSKSLLPFFQSGGDSKTSERHVLVMDEVDGMAGNEDRGGVAELITLIKNSKCPVICMCNDRNHPKIRSLAGHCFDLRFHKPRVEQIRGAMMSVCFKEKVKISPQALDEVIAGTNFDIRQILHNLSMWSSTEKVLNGDQVKADANTAKKNIKLGPWDAVRKIFSSDDHKSMTIMDKSDLFFHDYNLLPLFVQENYLNVAPHAAKKQTDTLRHIARAAASISYGDLIEKTIRSTNSWSLLPVQAIYSSVVPGDWMEGHFKAQIQFPSWLGKNSRGGKMNRLIQELQLHMRLSISGGKEAVNLNYLEPILKAVIHPLVEEGSQGVPKTLQAMQDYYITRDDLESLLELSRWPGRPDPMAPVDSKVKAALTRAYNKGGVMTPYALDAPIKKKRATGGGEEGYEEEEGEEGSASESEDDAADAMIKAKKIEKKDKKDARGTSASSSQASTSGRGSRGGARGGRGRGGGKNERIRLSQELSLLSSKWWSPASLSVNGYLKSGAVIAFNLQLFLIREDQTCISF